MAKQVQRRRGTAAENNAFTGAAGEVTVDTTANDLRVHDGTTEGGHPAGSVAVSAHNDDTTSVHGIADTSALETQAGAQGKVDAHADLTDNPHGVTAAQAGADPAGTASTAVSTHNSAADAHGARLPPTPVGETDGRILTVASDALVYTDAPSGGATAKNSIEVDGGDLQLVGDAASPGNSRYYGTSGAGVKGYHELPSGGGGGAPANILGMNTAPLDRVILWDNFDRAAGAVGDAPSGQTWDLVGGTPSIIEDSISTYVRNTTFVNDGGMVADCGTITVEIILRASGADASVASEGAVACYIDSSNYLAMRHTGTQVTLVQRVAGVSTNVAAAGVLPVGERISDAPPAHHVFHFTVRHRTDAIYLNARHFGNNVLTDISAKITDEGVISTFAAANRHGIGFGRNMRYYEIAILRGVE